MSGENKNDPVFFVVAGILFLDLIISQATYLWSPIKLVNLTILGETSLFSLSLFIHLFFYFSLLAATVLLAIKAFTYLKKKERSTKITAVLFTASAVLFLDLIIISIIGLNPLKDYLYILRYLLRERPFYPLLVLLLSSLIQITFLASAVVSVIIGIHIKNSASSIQA
jgi:hypothetical protein